MILDLPLLAKDELISDRVRQRAVLLVAGGMLPRDVAKKLALMSAQVRELVAGTEMPEAEERNHGSVHPLWNWDEDERRRAFYARAQQGARRTLREQFGHV